MTIDSNSKLFYYNTDAKSKRHSDGHHCLIKNSIAATGGAKKFGLQLGKVNRDDYLIMYENRVGIIAVGQAVQSWNGKKSKDVVYYIDDEYEYRIIVNWFLDFSANPITLDEMKANGLATPRGAVRRIRQPHQIVRDLIVSRMKYIKDSFPEEISSSSTIWEGAVTRVMVNAYERSAVARNECIKHYLPKCCICGFDFGVIYGCEFEGFIHVHHLVQLSTTGKEYQVDPVNDLRPVCPNCHAIIHHGGKLRDIEDVRDLIDKNKAMRLR